MSHFSILRVKFCVFSVLPNFAFLRFFGFCEFLGFCGFCLISRFSDFFSNSPFLRFIVKITFLRFFPNFAFSSSRASRQWEKITIKTRENSTSSHCFKIISKCLIFPFCERSEQFCLIEQPNFCKKTKKAENAQFYGKGGKSLKARQTRYLGSKKNRKNAKFGKTRKKYDIPKNRKNAKFGKNRKNAIFTINRKKQ